MRRSFLRRYSRARDRSALRLGRDLGLSVLAPVRTCSGSLGLSDTAYWLRHSLFNRYRSVVLSIQPGFDACQEVFRENEMNPAASPKRYRPPAFIPFPDTLALEKNAAVLNSASPRGLALLSTGVFLTVRENGMNAGGRYRFGLAAARVNSSPCRAFFLN